ncbi:MAG: UDP-N-acetylmuramate--L-alanine ligase [Clostridia bacterium]|nr:UDP-N-acetylmuramate--L-alanine ligase [Clostridia bacterium]
MNLNEINNVHFIGIGGAGMSGLAKILIQKGIKVSGSDLSNSKYVERLIQMGAQIKIGHHEDNVPNFCDLVVISSAIPLTNSEVQRARAMGIKIIKRGELLGELMRLQRGIAVAGAHGKTTTSSMIALILEDAGYDPTIVVGGELCNLCSNAKLGKGAYLVAEADESDGSFLELFPEIAIVTNIEDDHLDYYGSMDNIINAFQQYINQIPEGGTAFIGIDDDIARKLKPPENRKVKYYGLQDNNDFVAKNLIFKDTGSTSDIYYQKRFLGKLELTITGKHNIVNALGALGVAMEVGVSCQEATRALKKFKGVERRFQLLGHEKNVKVVDDYAHHPTEIKATLQAARQAHKGRVVAVFQPHRYSRTKQLYHEFGRSFSDADFIVITDIYAAGEQAIPGISGELIFQEAKKRFPEKQIVYKGYDDLTDYLHKTTRPGDLIITLGAGDIWKKGKELIHVLGE